MDQRSSSFFSRISVIVVTVVLTLLLVTTEETTSSGDVNSVVRSLAEQVEWLLNKSYRLFRNSLNAITEDPVQFAHRVYGGTIDFIRREGYPGEIHNATTADGFKLVLFRIPFGRSKEDNYNEVQRPVVLLIHGILCSSTDWVISGANNSLGFILADAGYDVWLGNVRGNTYSRKNIYYDENRQKKEYWDFCWHEMGIYDLPTTIDYILSTTNQKQIHYVAHSMGTTMFYVMCSERQNYCKKVKSMISLAPIAYLNHVRSRFFRLLTTISDPLAWLCNSLGFYEFRPGGKFLLYAGQVVCQQNSMAKSVCDNILFLIAGYDSQHINKTALPMILAHSPAGASSKQLTHYAQLIRKVRWFGQYDYGTGGNLKRYGTIDPPRYDLNKVKVPVTLMYSANDWLAATEDVLALANDLPNVHKVYPVPYTQYNHLDFVWAIDAKTLVYDECVRILKYFDRI